MPKHLVISTSGNPDSNSRRMGRAAFGHLKKKEIDCDWIDIREMDLPLCDADKCYGLPGSKKLSASKTRTSPRESNRSPTNSFASLKRSGAKLRFGLQLRGKTSCDPALPRALA